MVRCAASTACCLVLVSWQADEARVAYVRALEALPAAKAEQAGGVLAVAQQRELRQTFADFCDKVAFWLLSPSLSSSHSPRAALTCPHRSDSVAHA